MLELVFAIILPAFGSAILFNVGASSGGTDIIAAIVKKYSGADIGKALFLSDCFDYPFLLLCIRHQNDALLFSRSNSKIPSSY